ncbi:MAG: c-type cytochrome domain-containing protein [Bacteroidales bacterium]
MKRVLTMFLLGLTFIPVYLVSCKHEPLPGPEGQDTTNNPIISTNCDPDTVYFQNDILPLIQSSCAKSGCHDAATQADGVYLGTYASIMNTGKIKPGNPNDSELYEVITENDPDKIMPPPPNQPFSQAQINLIYTWIQQGAKNNQCNNQACDSVNVTFSGQIFPMIQASCLGCHSGGNPGGGISLGGYNDIKNNATAILGSISWASGFTAMPQNGSKLSPCKIAQFNRWIQLGTPNN